MNPILLTLGVLFAVAAGLGLPVFLFLRMRQARDDRATKDSPVQLSLKPRKGNWSDKDLMKALAEPLLARGFVQVGEYEATELPGVAMQMLLQPQDQALAVIFEHAKVGHWVDICSFFDDGSSVVYTTNPAARATARPGSIRLRGAGTKPGALYTKFKAERPDNRTLVTITEPSAAARYTKNYSDEATWRKTQGLPSDEVAALLHHRVVRGRL
jgi:hypothetical protein